MVIQQGDVFWANVGKPFGSESGYRRPYVVVQNNVFNASNINTVVVCALTTNLYRGTAPGNVTLNKGEANLPQKSVVNISQVIAVDRHRLEEKIGTLSKARMTEILAGLILLLEPREP